MTEDVIVRVSNVSKKFCRSLKHVMFYGTKDITRNMVGMGSKPDILRDGEFWAVNDVSFELRRGEALGIIGPNGSGKSTILKMLNGIFMPDKGEIEITGRVGALIEVGAGFHPMLSGRENIYINGSILGMSKRDIDKKLDKIIEFADIGEFIETPVKHYSSGMRVRLGFAIAAQMEPDILLIDEVLAVGDVGFRAKCFNALAKFSKKAAIILVSHAMPQVSRVCSNILVMNQGEMTYKGDVSKGINHYYSHFETEEGIVSGSGRATIHKIELESNGEKDIQQIHYLDELRINLHISVDSEIKHPIIFVGFLNQELQFVSQCSSLYNKVQLNNNGEPLHVTIKFPSINFNQGVYMLTATIFDETQVEVLTKHFAAKKFRVMSEFIGGAPVQLVGEWEIRQQALHNIGVE